MKDIQLISQQYQDRFIALIPSIVTSIAVLIIGFIIAKLVKHLILKLFKYAHKIAEQRGNTTDYTNVSSFLSKTLFWIIIFTTVLLITDYLGLSLIAGWFQSILHHIPNILAAVLIIFAAIVAGNLVSNVLKSFGRRTGFQQSQTMIKAVRFIFIALAIVIALDQIGIEISLLKNIIEIVLAALLFGASLAFALGAKTAISNILATFYIRKIYKEGDQIQIGESTGKIISITGSAVILENNLTQVYIPAKEFNEQKSFLIRIV